MRFAIQNPFRHYYSKQLLLWLNIADPLNGSQISLKKQQYVASIL